MTRWLGIDNGTRRMGVAVGSTDDHIATPVEVVPAQPPESAVERILQLARDYATRGIVVGLPLNMDGTESSQSALARHLAERLARAGDKQVRLFDERLSSFAADERLAGYLTRGKRRARQDALAAAAMLQDFLASQE